MVKNGMMRMGLLIGVCLLATQATAAPIHLDFQSDATDVATGYTYALQNDAWTGSAVRDGLTFGWLDATSKNATDRNASNFAPVDLLRDFVYGYASLSADRRTFRVGDLAAGIYDVTLYFYDHASAQGSDQEIEWSNDHSTFNLAWDGLDLSSSKTLVQETRQVTVNSNGYVEFRIDSNLTNWIINGMDIVAVPEPATFVLLAVGGLGVAAIRRRRA